MNWFNLRPEIGLLHSRTDWEICLLIIAIATVGKLGGTSLVAKSTGMNWRESLQLGSLMNTRGLMELIVLNLSYEMHILSQRLFSMLVLMAWQLRSSPGRCGLFSVARGAMACSCPELRSGQNRPVKRLPSRQHPGQLATGRAARGRRNEIETTTSGICKIRPRVRIFEHKVSSGIESDRFSASDARMEHNCS